VLLFHCFAECHYAEYHYAKCRVTLKTCYKHEKFLQASHGISSGLGCLIARAIAIFSAKPVKVTYPLFFLSKLRLFLCARIEKALDFIFESILFSLV
jgi:hypothetical protein